jgi:mono/diheme cytochrome c family protein
MGSEYKPDPGKSAEWNRGAYLVNGPAACTACHSPKSVADGNQYLTGADLQGWFAPNITDDKRVGLGSWTAEDVVAYLKTGHNRVTAATGPMATIIDSSTSRMPEADLKAIATYLKSLSGTPIGLTALRSDESTMVAGQAIFRDQCSACHALDGRGVPELFPSLAESSNVRSKDPQTLIRIVLEGARSVATAGEPTAPGMPSYGRELNDAQVAAVLTYVRNGFRDPAAPVSPEDVGRVRTELASAARAAARQSIPVTR